MTLDDAEIRKILVDELRRRCADETLTAESLTFEVLSPYASAWEYDRPWNGKRFQFRVKIGRNDTVLDC